MVLSSSRHCQRQGVPEGSLAVTFLSRHLWVANALLGPSLRHRWIRMLQTSAFFVRFRHPWLSSQSFGKRLQNLPLIVCIYAVGGGDRRKFTKASAMQIYRYILKIPFQRKKGAGGCEVIRWHNTTSNMLNNAPFGQSIQICPPRICSTVFQW